MKKDKVKKNEIQRIPLPPAKRIFDIFFSTLLLAVFFPFILFILLWILMEQIVSKSSRGPVFYCEARISQGKPFMLCKFRIFKQKALDNKMKKEHFIHTKELERNSKNLTFYGRILKRIYMDELPQLLNVLKGDMTLVGPRPTNIVNSESMRKSGDYTKEVIKCGITGPFQSEKGKKHDQRADDEEYIKFILSNHWRRVIVKDFKILYRTVRTIFEARGI